MEPFRPHAQLSAHVGLHRLSRWFLIVLLVVGGAIAILHAADIGRMAALMRHANIWWLFAALVLQGLTYPTAAAGWAAALRSQQVRFSFWALIPLSVAKLFSEQVVPSGGLSGTAFFVTALGRRGVGAKACFAALITSLISYYVSYIALALLAATLLAMSHHLADWIIVVGMLFIAVALGIPLCVELMRQLGGRRLPWIGGFPRLGAMLAKLAELPPVAMSPSTLVWPTLSHATVFLLDAATLWALLHSVGAESSWLIAFASFMVACMVATVGLVPLGLGTFEAASVGVLVSQGVSLHHALLGTLLFRFLTLWLPMLPGLWLIRRELRPQAKPPHGPSA